MKIFRTCIRIVYSAIWACLDRLAVGVAEVLSKSRSVLLVRLDAIGDFVLWSSAAKCLYEYYHMRGYKVVLFANEMWMDLVTEMKIADDIWGINVKRFEVDLAYRWRWLRRLRKQGFIVAIQPTYSRGFLAGDAAIRASNADERIGSEGDLSNVIGSLKTWSDQWYTCLVPATQKNLMEIPRNVEFMRGLGHVNFEAELPNIMVYDRKILELPPDPYVTLFPGGAWAGKLWPIAHFAETGKRLQNKGLSVVIAGGAKDVLISDAVNRMMGGRSLNLVGKTGLCELAEVLRRSRLVITNDTSAVHIAAAVGVRALCILGGGHFGRFLPYVVDRNENGRPIPISIYSSMPCFGCNWKCIYPRSENGTLPCIKAITPDQVWAFVAAEIGV